MITGVNSVKAGLEEKLQAGKMPEHKGNEIEKVKRVGEEKKTKIEEKGYVYEKEKQVSKSKEPYKINKMSEKERASIKEQLQKDLEARKSQLISLVNQTLNGQGKAISLATNDKDGIWKILAKGDFKVDEATKKQAKEDISEKGYWGVEKTAQRLFDFASALAGNDAAKMKEMKDAMLKGYKEATKAWGKELPEISKKTIEAANKLFDKYIGEREKENMASHAANQVKNQAGVNQVAKAPIPDSAVAGVKSVLM